MTAAAPFWTDEPGNEIVVLHKCVYGQHYYEPADDTAELVLRFCNPTGHRKAFTPTQLKNGTALGIKFLIREHKEATDGDK